MNTFVTSSLALAGLASSLLAQGGDDLARAVAAVPEVLPLHVATGAEPWLRSGGPSYRVDFRDGMHFRANVTGAGGQQPTLAWRTESIRAGSKTLCVPSFAAALAAGPHVVEARGDDVVERYEIRADGVEQSFVIRRRPEQAGDLVIEGVVTTELATPPVAPANRSLAFFDRSGRHVVTYGAATVIDAAGATQEVATSFADGRVRLHVSGAFLARAAYPVTVDPLIAVGPVAASPYPVDHPALARDPVTGFYLLAYEQIETQSSNVLAWQFDAQFANVSLVYSSANPYSSRPSVAVVPATRRWVVAHQAQGAAHVGVYVHAMGAAANAGTYLLFRDSQGGYSAPQVGGYLSSAAANNNVVLVMEHSAEFMLARVEYSVIDTAAARVVRTAALDPGMAVSHEQYRPAVAPAVDDRTHSWLAAWEVRDTANHSWIRVARIDAAGNTRGHTNVGPYFTGRSTFAPKVAGDQGEYVVTSLVGPTPQSETGDELWIQHIVWPEAGSPSFPGPFNPVRGRCSNDGLAFNHATRSHWGMAYRQYSGTLGRAWLARLGYTGAVAEWQSLTEFGTGGYAPAISNSGGLEFDFAMARNDAPFFPYMVYRGQFAFDPLAAVLPYGRVSCSPAQMVYSGLPFAGSRPGQVLLSGAPANQLALLWIASASADLPLESLGMPGCRLLVDPNSLAAGLYAGIDIRGSASFSVPTNISLRDFYLQCAHTGVRNALGVATTTAIHVRVR